MISTNRARPSQLTFEQSYYKKRVGKFKHRVLKQLELQVRVSSVIIILTKILSCEALSQCLKNSSCLCFVFPQKINRPWKNYNNNTTKIFLTHFCHKEKYFLKSTTPHTHFCSLLKKTKQACHKNATLYKKMLRLLLILSQPCKQHHCCTYYNCTIVQYLLLTPINIIVCFMALVQWSGVF